jgi:gliding motility-associated lipoprotein GldD
MMKKNKLLDKTGMWIILVFLSFTACNNEYYPKPRGYFRIDLPEKKYITFNTTYPYAFEYPTYARIIPDAHPKAEPYWINIIFPQFKGALHMSYKPIDGNLNEYLEDTRTMVMKHIPKASGIENKQYQNDLSRVYGMTSAISGVAAASPYQFYLTDSVNHFIRGALYFNTVPNNDSLAPVIEFLKADINHMIETFSWK